MAEDNFRSSGGDSMAALIANSGKTDPKMWEAIGNIPKAYYEGKEQAYKQKMRDVFSDENGGLPRDDKGNVDFQKAYERLVTVGGAPAIESAGSLATSGLTQDRIRFSPQAAETLSDGRDGTGFSQPNSAAGLCGGIELMASPENTEGKQGKRFQKGRSGNPNGRPKGSRNATTLALETLLDGQATALTQKAIDLAVAGDMAALRLCLDRILPPRKDRPVTFDFPKITTAAEAATTLSAILGAVAAGEITPGEASEIAKLVDSYVRAVDATELAARIERLERMTSQ